jgi:hypothetical protein
VICNPISAKTFDWISIAPVLNKNFMKNKGDSEHLQNQCTENAMID